MALRSDNSGSTSSTSTHATAVGIRQELVEHLAAQDGSGPVVVAGDAYEGVVLSWLGGGEAVTVFPDEDRPGYWLVTAYELVEHAAPAVEESVPTGQVVDVVVELLRVLAENITAEAGAPVLVELPAADGAPGETVALDAGQVAAWLAGAGERLAQARPGDVDDPATIRARLADPAGPLVPGTTGRE